jgi:Histidine kinase-, DNA gyrase B-, and HSP90-like ATPase
MGEIRKAIEKFIRKRLAVYRADSQQIIRDTRTAERAAKDQTGRWLFELLQNSDDARASEVRVLVKGDTVYVADDGHGRKPEAVSAICGTDFSDKTSGTIGRKGVGFKSVYEVSRNTQVLTVKGECIEFSQDKAKEWLKQNGLDDGYVPYQWIPFFFSWDEARRKDPALDSVENYKTVVKLASTGNIQNVKQLLKGWPPHALFAFRHVRQINAPDLKITLTPGDGTWEMNDSRGETPTLWRVLRHTEKAPQELLGLLGADERQAIHADGVSFLIATPIENDRVTPTKDYLPIHVFYPTEQKGPVRLLLHAEFLVKSDRTALMPSDDNPFNPFNAWVAERLARHVCEFANNSYRPDKPSSHAALLVPFGDRASHPVAEGLWQLIADKAKAALRLADVDGQQRLTVGDARLNSVTIRPDLARTLLEATGVRRQLLDRAFDEDKEAIAKNADLLTAKTHWMWACWEWLAAWVAKEPYGDKHRERVAQVRSLPIVPVERRLFRPADLAGRIVTWRPGCRAENLPDWLPLTFVEDWFRDRIQAVTEQDRSVKELCAELDIKEPGADVIQRAVGRAIEQYWKDRQGVPERFLRFILEQDWHETSESSSELQRCPVPLSQPMQGEAWTQAGKAYIGCEWGNDVLTDLYAGIGAVAWVRNDGKEFDHGRRRRVLEWLGAADCPRAVKKSGETNVWQ